jgi:hypothetical protein
LVDLQSELYLLLVASPDAAILQKDPPVVELSDAAILQKDPPQF